MRLAFIPRFKRVDTVLLSGTPHEIGALVLPLYEFLTRSLEEWPIHEHVRVSRRYPAQLFASRSRMSDRTGFRWRCSPAELPSIQAGLQALAASPGHARFPLAGSPVRLVVSAGEYTEVWWQRYA